MKINQIAVNYKHCALNIGYTLKIEVRNVYTMFSDTKLYNTCAAAEWVICRAFTQEIGFCVPIPQELFELFGYVWENIAAWVKNRDFGGVISSP